jgi:hypothetical protein
MQQFAIFHVEVTGSSAGGAQNFMAGFNTCNNLFDISHVQGSVTASGDYQYIITAHQY